jgi:hypothetical protein
MATAAATAKRIFELADDLDQAGDCFDIAITKLAAITATATPIVSEANGLATFSAMSKIEVWSAITMITELLREHAEMVRAGTAGV